MYYTSIYIVTQFTYEQIMPSSKQRKDCLHPEVAVSAFVVAYAVNYAITKSHKIPPPLYVPGWAIALWH